MDQQKLGKRIAKRCVTGCVLIVLSLFICGPAFAANFDKYPGKVRIETSAPGVEITITDIFGHPVEVAVIRLRSPIGASMWLDFFKLPVPGGFRHLMKENRYEVARIGTVKDGRFTYRIKYTSASKAQVRDLTHEELWEAEKDNTEGLIPLAPWPPLF